MKEINLKAIYYKAPYPILYNNDILEKANCEDNKKDQQQKKEGRQEEDEQAKQRILGQWKYLKIYYTDEYMSLYICPYSQTVPHQE